MRRLVLTAAALAFVATTAVSAPAEVHVGVHIGIPAPPVFVYERAPRLVVVPGVPHVEYAPDVSENFFVYGGRYYTYYDGGWFVADGGRGPWTYVERRYVPAPILRVPSRYYHVPPRVVRGNHWHGKNASYYRHGNDKHWDHGHGRGHDSHGNGRGNGHGHGTGHQKEH